MINLEPFSKLIINCQSKIRLKLDVSEVKPSYYLFVHTLVYTYCDAQWDKNVLYSAAIYFD